MKTPKVLYILIGVFCVFAIIAGVYAQFFEKGTETEISNNQNKPTTNEKDAATIKEEFNSIFTNTINLNGFDDTQVIKKKADQGIVYTAYDIKKNESAYEVNIKLPVVNIKNDVANSFNVITQSVFVDKANEILKKTDATTKTIYGIDYVAYVNDDILSLIIRSTLKEGQNAQRVIVQAYNYNLTTNTKVTLNELIAKKNLNKDDINAKIRKVVEEADKEAKAIQSMGYTNIFSRDLTSDMYTVDNSSLFFLGEDQKLYIIYAYGNQNFTSELDIVLFE